MEKIFTEEFWQGIAAAVMAPSPWNIIPLVLLSGFVGWWVKGALDGREIRGLKAENKALEADKNAAVTRLKLAHDSQEVVTKQLEVLKPEARNNEAEIAELKKRFARMESSIPDLVKTAILAQLDKAATTSVAVTTSVNNLSAANLAVGAILTPPSTSLNLSTEAPKVQVTPKSE